jgi:hypothetical protein
MRRNVDVEAEVVAKYVVLEPLLDERARRYSISIELLNAARLYGYDRPQAPFIQKMPNIAPMDTSTASSWVTDSAAGIPLGRVRFGTGPRWPSRASYPCFESCCMLGFA